MQGTCLTTNRFQTCRQLATSRVSLPHHGPALRQSVIVGAKSKGGHKQSALSELIKRKDAGANPEGGESVADGVASTSGRVLATSGQYNDPELRMLLFCIVQSYFKQTRKFLMEGVDFEELPHALYNAPFILLAHDRFQEGVTDPQFIYANKNALRAWEATWDELIGLPSRLSAVPEEEVQVDRQRLLDQAATTGVITNYDGWRVSTKGRKFRIKGVTLFNIQDMDGEKIGQAAVFDRYLLPCGTEVLAHEDPNVVLASRAPKPLPTKENIAAAEADVAVQADAIRAMKAQGMTNQDPAVIAAVSQLKALKTVHAGMVAEAKEARK